MKSASCCLGPEVALSDEEDLEDLIARYPEMDWGASEKAGRGGVEVENEELWFRIKGACGRTDGRWTDR